MKLARSENDIKNAVIKYLRLRGYWVMRLNTGAFSGEYHGKRRFVRFAVPGCADILAIRQRTPLDAPSVVWIETKSETGRQTERQRQFEREVKAVGCWYFVVRSLDDLKELWLYEG